MKILDKIKELFSRRKIKTIPEHTTSDDVTPVGTTFTRDDGTQITVRPQLDKLGNQLYEQVFNNRTRQFQTIPRYLITCDELSEVCGPQVLSKSILIDLDPNIFKSSENLDCLDYVANHLLSKNRIGKIINEYGSYAGGISFDDSGNMKKYVDTGIIQSLSANKEEKQKMMELERARREEADAIAIRKNAENIQVHYKYSHAEGLSK